jgi:hypothetical protein
MSETASLVAAPLGPPPAPATAVGFFQRSEVATVILGTFFLVTLPLAAIIWSGPSNLLMWAYIWLFGMTHFVMTFTVYLNRSNLSYFGRTWRNRLIFFALPLIIFVGFDLIHALGVSEAFPIFALYFWGGVRLLDFNHLNRQSFGVLQLFKGRAGIAYPKGLKRLENWYFGSLTLLLMTTYLAGGVCPMLQSGGPLSASATGKPLITPALPIPLLQIMAAVLLVAAGIILTVLVVQYRRARASKAGARDQALVYLAFQTLSALLGVVSFPLYAASLAIHYVEYHVLMYPRCFHLRLDETSRVDRFFARARRSPLLFYTAVLALAALVTAFSIAGMGMMGAISTDPSAAPNYLAVIAIFDGLFVFHYLVEAYIWRFSDPHFRRSLVGLYFAPAPARQ